MAPLRAYRPGNGANAVSGDDMAEGDVVQRMHWGTPVVWFDWEPPATEMRKRSGLSATIAGGGGAAARDLRRND
jgi:hypothetical protein